MANTIRPHGRFRITSFIPPQAALHLIERAAAADRSVSAYVADVLMAFLLTPPAPLPQLKGGRRPKADAEPARTAAKAVKADAARQGRRRAQVAAMRSRAAQG
jgi:hypothetical protein